MLGLLLAIPIEQAEQIELRGTIHDTSVPPPPHDQLLADARWIRPDLVAYRLGVRRAAADVQLAEAEKIFGRLCPLHSLRPAQQRADRRPERQQLVGGRFRQHSAVQPQPGQHPPRTAQRLANAHRIGRAGTTDQRRSPQRLHRISGQSRYRQPARRSILPRSRRIRDSSLRLLEQEETAQSIIWPPSANTTTSCGNIATRSSATAAACCG